MLSIKEKNIYIYVCVEDEFRSLTAWRMKLLCSVVVQQQILLYLLSDGSRLNTLLVLSFSIFGLCADISLH